MNTYPKGINMAIGHTPMIEVETLTCCFMAKMESLNPFGSMKDRAAIYVIEKLLKCGEIDKNTTIIESSSGNFAIALSATCKALGMKAVCVVDPYLTTMNRQILEQYGAELIWANISDANNSYQADRIRIVKNYLTKHKNSYWTNQYDNILIQQAYFSLAEEISTQCPNVEYIYIPVSTCATLAGISIWFKQKRPQVKIIAVDVKGAQIFGQSIGHCHFPGMGSRVKPGNLKNAKIDDVVIVSDYECLTKCHALLEQGVFVGASSGGITAAIEKTKRDSITRESIVGIFPDRGDRYLDNIYDKDWCSCNITQLLNDK